MSDTLLHALGWRSLLIHGDPSVLDRWLWLRRVLRPGPLRTLDAGCGNGAFSIFAARAGNRVVAASFSEREQSDARRRAEELGIGGIDFRLIDLRELTALRESLGRFDQIICLETIEHVTDDGGLVASLAALLDPRGQLLLTTPYADHRPLYTEDPEPSRVEDGSHVRFGYTAERLREIAHAAGLQGDRGDVRQRRRVAAAGQPHAPADDRLGRVRAWVLVLPLRVLPLRHLVILDRPLSALMRYPYLSVAMAATRT